jgi:hypothetical protein
VQFVPHIPAALPCNRQCPPFALAVDLDILAVEFRCKSATLSSTAHGSRYLFSAFR